MCSLMSSSPVSASQSVKKTASMAATVVLLRVVGAVDEILRPDESDGAVDDQQLAVIAQVGALVLALQRLHGQHPGPLHAHPVELGQHVLGAGKLARRDVVGQQAHCDATLDRVLHGLEETARGVVEGGDVELDVHEPGGLLDLARHRVELLPVVRDKHGGVAGDRRQVREGTVLLDDALEPARPPRVGDGHVGRVLREQSVDELLLVATTLRQMVEADKEEQDGPQVRDQHDRQQPGHRGRRLAVARHHHQEHDADHQVDEQRDGPDDVDPHVTVHSASHSRGRASRTLPDPAVGHPGRGILGR